MIASVEYTENPADKNSLNLTCWSKLDIKLVWLVYSDGLNWSWAVLLGWSDSETS